MDGTRSTILRLGVIRNLNYLIMTTTIGIFILTWIFGAIIMTTATEEENRGEWAVWFWSTLFAIGVTLFTY